MKIRVNYLSCQAVTRTGCLNSIYGRMLNALASKVQALALTTSQIV